MKKILFLIALIFSLAGCVEERDFPAGPKGSDLQDAPEFLIEGYQLSLDLGIVVDSVYTVTEGWGTTLVYGITAVNNSGETKSVMIKGLAYGPNIYPKSFELDWRVQRFNPGETKAYNGSTRVLGVANSNFEMDVCISYDLGRTWITLYNIRNLRNDDDF